MPRPNVIYLHFAQLLAIFLGISISEKWEEMAKLFIDPSFHQKLEERHYKRTLTGDILKKARTHIALHPKLNYTTLRKCAFKIATLLQFVTDASDFFEK